MMRVRPWLLLPVTLLMTILQPVPGARGAEVVARVDFGPAGAAVPSGYLPDSGEAFDAARGFGWVAQDSTAPLSLVGNGRDRNKVADQRLDTLIHMQMTGTGAGVKTPGRWEYALPTGTYDVTVAVGDAAYVDSTHRLTIEGNLAIDNFKPTTSSLFETATVRVTVSDGRLTLDAAGGTNTKLDYVDIATVPSDPPPGVSAKVDFGPVGAAVPSGYAADTGEGFDSGRGFGWIAQDSAAPLSLVGNGRDRNKVADQRLDTLIHMQMTGTASGVKIPGRWEYSLPADTYDVTVAVGDAAYVDSTHRLTIEGNLAIDNFKPTTSNLFKTATVRVTVSDGRLTLDAAGGTNTKLGYVDITSVSADPPPPPPPPPPGGFVWSTVKNLPQARSEGQGGVVGSKLYVFGGYVDSTFVPSARSDVYDPTTNTWSPLAPIPAQLTHSGTAVDGQSIYLAGGYTAKTGGGQIFAVNNVFRYDVPTNTWSSMPSLPSPRGAGALVRLDRQLHFFGGIDINRTDRGEHWILDLDNPTGWTASASLPNPRSHMGHIAYAGRIYAIGGEKGYDSNGVAQTSVHVWNPASPNGWSSAAGLPVPRSHVAAGTFELNGRIYIAGGEPKHATPVNTVYSYDPAANQWQSTTPLPANRHSGVVGVVSGNVYYSGGSLTSTVFKGTPQ